MVLVPIHRAGGVNGDRPGGALDRRYLQVRKLVGRYGEERLLRGLSGVNAALLRTLPLAGCEAKHRQSGAGNQYKTDQIHVRISSISKPKNARDYGRRGPDGDVGVRSEREGRVRRYWTRKRRRKIRRAEPTSTTAHR